VTGIEPALSAWEAGLGSHGTCGSAASVQARESERCPAGTAPCRRWPLLLARSWHGATELDRFHADQVSCARSASLEWHPVELTTVAEAHRPRARASSGPAEDCEQDARCHAEVSCGRKPCTASRRRSSRRAPQRAAAVRPSADRRTSRELHAPRQVRPDRSGRPRRVHRCRAERGTSVSRGGRGRTWAVEDWFVSRGGGGAGPWGPVGRLLAPPAAGGSSRWGRWGGEVIKPPGGSWRRRRSPVPAHPARGGRCRRRSWTAPGPYATSVTANPVGASGSPRT